MWVLSPAQAEHAALLLVGYAAVILSFMGAIYWGLVMGRGNDGGNNWYIVGVLPALVGWFALMLPLLFALTLLALAFAAVYALDRKAIRAELAPAWYGRLRAPLSATVVALLLLSAASASIRLV